MSGFGSSFGRPLALEEDGHGLKDLIMSSRDDGDAFDDGPAAAAEGRAYGVP